MMRKVKRRKPARGKGSPAARSTADTVQQEPRQEELLATHRWGRSASWFDKEDPRGKQELASLTELWQSCRPLDEAASKLLDQIRALEICNWRLEESILDLCAAISRKQPSDRRIGHLASVTDERWRKVWTYYAALRSWVPRDVPAGYRALLQAVEPEETLQNRILTMLGDRTALKELYVERFCLCLEKWLSGYPPADSVQMKAHNAAVAAVEAEIQELDPERAVAPEAVLQNDGDGRLQPCNHKAFYRYDLITSSIGAGKWRAAMGRRRTDGLARADTLESYLAPIELWTQGKAKIDDELAARIQALLGAQDSTKLFLASLLVSLLRPQQLAAAELARRRAESQG